MNKYTDYMGHPVGGPYMNRAARREMNEAGQAQPNDDDLKIDNLYLALKEAESQLAQAQADNAGLRAELLKGEVIHLSDCSLNNEPAELNGPCDCLPIRVDGEYSIYKKAFELVISNFFTMTEPAREHFLSEAKEALAHGTE